ncbi:hypothetical protein OG729_16745 [Streptomyces sp. NBC_00210]|uniref:hypothetical protein n=1 Tax=unclassified Streptomyces TaxID=2593676 RepID=UPI0032460CCC
MRKLLAVGFMAITLTLTVAGCSKQPANRPADAAAASKETAETGPRPLAQAELAASRLTEQETATLKYVSMWTDNTLEAFADIKRVSATPAPCQPVADAIYRGYPDGSTAYADVSYSEKDSALVAGYISLSSDSAAGAEKFFDAVRSSLEQCDQFTHTGRYGDTITTMITMGPSDTVGDESITFTTSSKWKMPNEDGLTEDLATTTLVRSGSVTLSFDLGNTYPSGFPKGKRTMPKVDPELIARQVAKVQAAQGT